MEQISYEFLIIDENGDSTFAVFEVTMYIKKRLHLLTNELEIIWNSVSIRISMLN